MAGGRAASAVLPRSTLAIHIIGKMGMGTATVYGDARWAEAASFAALLQRSRAASDLLGPAAPLLLAPVRFRCERTGTAGGPDQGLEPSE